MPWRPEPASMRLAKLSGSRPHELGGVVKNLRNGIARHRAPLEFKEHDPTIGINAQQVKGPAGGLKVAPNEA